MKHLHYSWVMVILGALAVNIMSIRFYTFGVFLVPLTTQFNWGRGAFSGASAVGALVSAVAAIIGGRLSDRYGPRPLVTAFGLVTAICYILLSQISSLWHVYLIFGLLMPIGMSGCYVPVMSTISRWFSKKRATAIGVTVTGFGLGGVMWPPIAQLLISSYGWQWAFVVLALITVVVAIPVAQFMKYSPQRARLLPYGESAAAEGSEELSLVDGGLSLREALKTQHFWLWGPVLFCFSFSLDLVITHIVPYALDAGIPAIVAATTLSIIAGISIVGRLSGGPISDRIGLKKMVSGSLILIMVALAALLSDQGGWPLYAFTLIFGLGNGLFIISETAIPADLFGAKSLGTIMATVGLFGKIGSAAGRTLAGTIFDITGSYQMAFLISTVLVVTAIILSVFLLRSGVPTAQSVTKRTSGQY